MAGHSFLDHGGEAGRLIAAHDWHATPLGPIADWPQALCFTLGLGLGSPFPTAIYWGADLRLLYNDAWLAAHPERSRTDLGRPAADVWGPVWGGVRPMFESVLHSGKGVAAVNEMFVLDRGGAPVETWSSYSLTPIRDDEGAVAGIFNQGFETTKAVLADHAHADRAEAEAALQASEQRLRLALDASTGIGTWDWDVQRDSVSGDARFAALFGVAPERVNRGGPMADFYPYVHPDDRERVRDAVTATLALRAP